MDAIANEPQFIDHLAPVWQALPDRGRFIVEPRLVDHARKRGIEAEPFDRLMVNRGGVIRPNRNANRPALVASYGDIKEARRMGYGPLVFLEHGAGQSYRGNPRAPQAKNPSYAGGADRDDVGLFLVPNEPCADQWRTAYPAARVEVVGSPRLDGLPRRQLDPIAPSPTVCISFHWSGHWIAPEAGNALGTFAPVLPELAKRFHVIGHAHPKGDWPDQMARVYRRAGIEMVRDFEDVCRQADVYVCDNSSTIPEFASTDRPVVLMNDRTYRKSVNHGGRFWDWAHIGIQVDDPALLGDAIEEALRDAPESRAAREAALSIVYAHRSGGAARAVRVITEWLASREEIAA